MSLTDIVLVVAYFVLAYLPIAYAAYFLARKGVYGIVVSLLLLAYTIASIFLDVLSPTLVSYPVIGLLLARQASNKLGLSLSYSIVAGFTAIGLLVGMIQLVLWPSEAVTYYDPLGNKFGYWVHEKALEAIGEPVSPYASSTVPLLFQLPYILVVSSLAAWLAIGIVVSLTVKATRYNASATTM
jgi:hypothetical protein